MLKLPVPDVIEYFGADGWHEWWSVVNQLPENWRLQ